MVILGGYKNRGTRSLYTSIAKGFLGNEMSKEIPKTSNASKARELFAANTDMTVESGSFVVGDAIGDLVARCLASMRS